jgi:hypothetical protein
LPPAVPRIGKRALATFSVATFSVATYLYLSGGNLSECFVTGRIAGSEAAGLAGWCA